MNFFALLFCGIGMFSIASAIQYAGRVIAQAIKDTK